MSFTINKTKIMLRIVNYLSKNDCVVGGKRHQEKVQKYKNYIVVTPMIDDYIGKRSKCCLWYRKNRKEKIYTDITFELCINCLLINPDPTHEIFYQDQYNHEGFLRVSDKNVEFKNLD